MNHLHITERYEVYNPILIRKTETESSVFIFISRKYLNDPNMEHEINNTKKCISNYAKFFSRFPKNIYYRNVLHYNSGISTSSI